MSLLDDSVRVAGRSDVPVRVVGVDLVRRDLVDAPDERVRAAEAAVRDAGRSPPSDGVDAGDQAREEMLGHSRRVVVAALSLDAHLRATAPNTSGQVLLAGPVSTFLADAFVGTTAVEQTAPGADIELALGVDDRVVVERELAERTAHRARFGANRVAVERWTITATNRRTAQARVTVRDRLPVSRHADIEIVDVTASPEPTERDDLGRLEWVAQVAPGASWEASVRFGVEHPRTCQSPAGGSHPPGRRRTWDGLRDHQDPRFRLLAGGHLAPLYGGATPLTSVGPTALTLREGRLVLPRATGGFAPAVARETR